jgi:hypothetical protein
MSSRSRIGLEDMEMWLVFAAIGVFVGGAAVYLAFMIFLPEWVGITGKTALEAEQSHRGEAPKDSAEMSPGSISPGNIAIEADTESDTTGKPDS